MRYRTLIVAFLILCLGVFTGFAGKANAAGRDQLTYDQILNTGLANSCPQVAETRRGSLPIEPGQSYSLSSFCVEPLEYFVKEEPINKRQEAEFIQGKVLTRYTSTLEQITGTITANQDGSLTFVEEDGIDFQPITILLPGGEQVPFLFTIKNLVATSRPEQTSINTSTDFEGSFKVPSYRGAVFLDPKGRGVASGYDNAVALPSQADEDELTRANVKQFVGGKGTMTLQITKIDSATGEIGGTFQSEQPSATDLGAEDPEDVKVRGIFYGRLTPNA